MQFPIFLFCILGLLYKQSRTHQRKLQLQRLLCLYNNPKPIGKKGELQLQFPPETLVLPLFHSEVGGTVFEVSLAITGCFLLVLIRDDSASIVHPQNICVCCWAVVVGGASVAGASGHLEDSMPRVRGDSVGVTPILRHDRLVFLNNLGIIFSLQKCL